MLKAATNTFLSNNARLLVTFPIILIKLIAQLDDKRGPPFKKKKKKLAHKIYLYSCNLSVLKNIDF